MYMSVKSGKSIVFVMICVLAFMLSFSVGVFANESPNMAQVDNIFNIQGSNVVINKNVRLFQDTVVTGDLELRDGELDLDGNELVVTGNLIQKGGKIILNGGKLKVEKNYTIGSEGNYPNAYL